MEDIQKVFDFLQKAGTFYLATVEGDQPRVRPYGAKLLFEGKIYIMAFGKTNATRQEVGRALIEKMPILKDALG